MPQDSFNPIPYGHQDISLADIEEVVATLRSDWLTQGPAVERFEEALSSYCGARFATATANATCALHLACSALGLQPGDWLWTSPNTFVASANCGLYCGARVDFVDIDPLTHNLSVPKLEAKLTAAKARNQLPKVVVAVDFAGQSCEMSSIRRLADVFGFRIIEDASHAVGGEHLGVKIGSCRWADVTVFSFHPVKIITTGEGGAALTNDPRLHQHMTLMRSHGITRDACQLQGKKEGPWYYEQVALGFNYRLTDIQAALGTRQLGRIDEFLSRRRQLVSRYNQAFANLPVKIPYEAPENRSSWHLYVVELDAQQRRLEIVEQLRSEGIMANVHYIPVHLQPYYQRMGFRRGDFPTAEAYYERAISLPLFFGLSDLSQDRVISALQRAVV